MSTIRKVSYCVGVYNEEKLLPKNIRRIDRFLHKYVGKGNYEIIVVDNASSDHTNKICKNLSNEHIRYFFTNTKGFGAAFKVAFVKSKFEHIVFTAIDLPFGFSDFKIAYAKWDSFDIIFGSKSHPQTTAERSFTRRISTYIYQLLLSSLFKNRILDTQGSLFLKKTPVKKILPYITACNAFFSTQVALYAQHMSLQITEIPVILRKESVSRRSKYKVVADGGKMFKQLLYEAYLYHGGARVFILLSFLFVIVFLLSFLSFNLNMGLHLYFWRDDWTAFWFLKNDIRFYFTQWILPGRHPGEFTNTFPWFYLFSLNTIPWQIMGILLKTFAALSTGLFSYLLFKNKKTAVISSLFFASYFGGLEGFTWISARLSAQLIILYAITFFSFNKFIENRRYLEIALIECIILLILEPGRSVFFVALLLFYALAKKRLSKRLVFFASLTILLGLFLTTFGRTMLGFKSAELVSPYAENVLQRAYSLKAIESYWASLSSLVVGQTFADLHPSKIYLVGIIFFAVFILLSVYYILRRKKAWVGIIFSLLWVILFYSSGWISDPGNLVAAHNRYFTIPSVGIVMLIAFVVSKLPMKMLIILLTIFLCFNINQSQRAIQVEYSQRGESIVLPLLQEQESSVPKIFTHGVFIVTGWNPLRGYVFDWSYGGGLPFALQRNLSNPVSVPVFVNYKEAQDLLCQVSTPRYYLDNYIPLIPEKLSINDVYSWNVTDNGQLENTTNTTRKELVTSLSCLQ